MAKHFGDVKDAMKMFSNTSNNDTNHNTHNTLDMANELYAHNDDITSNVYKRETKSKRFSLLLRPSILTALNKIARMENNSTTDIINTVLEDYVQAQSTLIEKYETLFDENGRPKI